MVSTTIYHSEYCKNNLQNDVMLKYFDIVNNDL